LQALAFLISLRSLSTGRDASSLDVTTFLTFGGFVVMFLATGITILMTPASSQATPGEDSDESDDSLAPN
jgi:hypothetical protein